MLIHRGSELVGYSGGPSSAALTIPSGTDHIVIALGREDFASVSVGGVALTHVATSGHRFWYGDISGRANDTLSWGAGDAAYIAAHYLGCNDLGVLATGSESATVGWHAKTSAAPTVSQGNAWGCCHSHGTNGANFIGFDDEETYFVTGTPPNTANGGAHVTPAGAPDATVTVGMQQSHGFVVPGDFQWAFFEELNPTVELAPSGFGSEAGFRTGIEVGLSDQVMLYLARSGAEAGFRSGLRLRNTGQRQVMLTGSRIETPEMTVGGTEGQVLTQHAKSLPTWEDPSGSGGDSLHIDTSVSGAHTVDRADGATHDLTLTGDATFTLAGALTDQATDLRVLLRQDGTGGHTVTWPGSVEWAGGVAPTLQADPDALDAIGLLSVDDGTTWLGFYDQTGGGGGTAATTVEDETTWGITPAVGTDTEYARQDHTHGTPAEPTGGGSGLGPLVLASDHAVPIVFDDILQASDGSDLIYASEP